MEDYVEPTAPEEPVPQLVPEPHFPAGHVSPFTIAPQQPPPQDLEEFIPDPLPAFVEREIQPQLFQTQESQFAFHDPSVLPDIPFESQFIPPAEPTPPPVAEETPQTEAPRPEPATPHSPAEDIQTDGELAQALHPIIEDSLQKALYAPETGIHTYLEPMLRNTVRRAIAEQMESSSQFHQISSFDRFSWRMKALLSSRSYEEILFEETKRYQVEEVYMLRRDTLDMLSYASSDPVRHASVRRVVGTVETLRDELCDTETQVIISDFILPGNRNGIVREGDHTFLIAIMRGEPNALVRSDLDYLLHQIEERFDERLLAADSRFMTILQPMLEAGLLIQAPAAR